jgi:hypothetical protein
MIQPGYAASIFSIKHWLTSYRNNKYLLCLWFTHCYLLSITYSCLFGFLGVSMPAQLWESKYLIFYNILLFSFWRQDHAHNEYNIVKHRMTLYTSLYVHILTFQGSPPGQNKYLLATGLHSIYANYHL